MAKRYTTVEALNGLGGIELQRTVFEAVHHIGCKNDSEETAFRALQHQHERRDRSTNHADGDERSRLRSELLRRIR